MADMKASLRTLKKRQERRAKGSSGTATDTPPKCDQSEKIYDESVISESELSQRWGEVEFLLKSPLKSDDDILSAKASAAQGLKFIQDLTRFSSDMNENRGMLLRWVLPFDATTSIADQGNVKAVGSYEGAGTGSAVSESQIKVFSSHIDEATKADLLAGALALRQLVRVKLSDEADLKQGTRAVEDTHTFLNQLCQAAKQRGETPITLLSQL